MPCVAQKKFSKVNKAKKLAPVVPAWERPEFESRWIPDFFLPTLKSVHTSVKIYFLTKQK